MQQLEDAKDRSSYVVQLDFTDEEGNAVVPVSATWTLTDGTNVINNQEDVVIGSLASTVYIALSGDDLAYTDGDHRVLVVEGTYLSSLTGATLPTNAGCWFRIIDLPQV